MYKLYIQYFKKSCQEKKMRRKLIEPKIILLVGMMGF